MGRSVGSLLRVYLTGLRLTLLRPEAVAHRAHAGERVVPLIAPRDAEHLHDARTEAKPLHHEELVAGALVTADRDDLVTRHAADPHLLGVDHAHVRSREE